MQKINLKIFFKKRNQRISFFSISPTFDWIFILIVSMLIFSFGAVYIGRVYIKILDESLFIVPVDENAQQALEDKQRNIEKTVNKIKERNMNMIIQGEVPEEEILTNQE